MNKKRLVIWLIPIITSLIGIGLAIYLLMKEYFVYGGDSLLELGAYLILTYTFFVVVYELLAIYIAKKINVYVGIIFFIIILSVSILIFKYYTDWQNSSINKDIVYSGNNLEPDIPHFLNYSGSFSNSNGNYYGHLYITGYTYIETKSSKMFGTGSWDYVFFKIIDTKNDYIDDYLKLYSGNAFVNIRENAIGIGCLSGDKIIYYNANQDLSDDQSFDKVILDKSTTTGIINSNPNKLILLRFEKNILKNGSGAPICYSHFDNIIIVK